MATLVTQPITQAGTIPAYVAAAAGGDKVSPGPTTWLHVKNGGGAPITVTVDSVTPCSQGSDHNLAVVVNNGAEKMIGPLPADRFASAVDGLVAVTYSAVTTVTVGVFA